MDVRFIDLNKDYITLHKWWISYKWGVIDKDILPSIGIMVDEIVAGFLYQSDSKIAWLEWIISDPNANILHKAKCVSKLIDELIKIAKVLEYKVIFSSSNLTGLGKLYLKSGAIETDTEVTHYIWKLS